MDKRIIPAGEALEIYTPDRGPFDKGVAALREAGVALWTPAELAETRIRAGAQDPVSREWSWVAPAFLYDASKNADILVVSGSYSPLLKNPEAATAAYRDGKEFYVTAGDFAEMRERAAKDPKDALQSGVLLFPRTSVRREIPSHAFGEYPLTMFLFEDQAQAYGAFLEGAGIRSVPLYVVHRDYAEKQSEPLARALDVNGLDGRSSLDGINRYIHFDNGRVRGVHRIERPAEQAAPEIPRETVVSLEVTIQEALQAGRAFEHGKNVGKQEGRAESISYQAAMRQEIKELKRTIWGLEKKLEERQAARQPAVPPLPEEKRSRKEERHLQDIIREKNVVIRNQRERINNLEEQLVAQEKDAEVQQPPAVSGVPLSAQDWRTLFAFYLGRQVLAVGGYRESEPFGATRRYHQFLEETLEATLEIFPANINPAKLRQRLDGISEETVLIYFPYCSSHNERDQLKLTGKKSITIPSTTFDEQAFARALLEFAQKQQREKTEE